LRWEPSQPAWSACAQFPTPRLQSAQATRVFLEDQIRDAERRQAELRSQRAAEEEAWVSASTVGYWLMSVVELTS
jgi:hypothetical protein